MEMFKMDEKFIKYIRTFKPLIEKYHKKEYGFPEIEGCELTNNGIFRIDISYILPDFLNEETPFKEKTIHVIYDSNEDVFYFLKHKKDDINSLKEDKIKSDKIIDKLNTRLSLIENERKVGLLMKLMDDYDKSINKNETLQEIIHHSDKFNNISRRFGLTQKEIDFFDSHYKELINMHHY